MSEIKESMNQKHLRVVNEIAKIFEREFNDSDDIFFVIRTLRNIFLWDEESSQRQHDFNVALEKFARTNKVFLEQLIKTKGQ